MFATPPLPVAVLLAIVQGLTEFLPVSSDGHLALLQNTILPDGDYLFFDLVIHVGTLAALVAYFRRDLWTLSVGVFRPGAGDPRSSFHGHERRTVLLLLLTTAVTAAIGFSIEDVAQSSFRNLWIVAAGFALTTVYLVLGSIWRGRDRGPGRIRWGDATLVGVLQAAAVFPGVSRSGGTIVGALLLGFDRDTAARYSFLAGIPAIAGAFLLECLHLGGGIGAQPWGLHLLAAVVSGVVGYASIALLLRVVRTGSLAWFAAYEAAITVVTALLASRLGS